MQVRRATEADWSEVVALVRFGGLPAEGLKDQFPTAYWVAIADDRLLGVVGLERYGAFGLLRSLAVAEGQQSRGVGGALIQHAQQEAQADGLAAVFLLTTTAADFFARHGFAVLARALVPDAVRISPEFASICPDSAASLHWTIREPIRG
jgi:N-acetylglutamate synthase-like GNAT family acetyltransferase